MTNQALGSFLHVYVSASVKNILSGTDPQDGLGILAHLQNLYAPATIHYRNEAQAHLNQLQMHPKDTITNFFVVKFRCEIKTLSDVSLGMPIPTDYELINLFIQKCLNTIPQGSDLRNTILSYQWIIKFLPFKCICI